MPEKKESKSNSRPYVVLILPDEVETIQIEASTPEQAINLVAVERGAGHYGSSTVRSWAQQKISFVQQAPKLVAEDVKPSTKAKTAKSEQQELAPAGAI
jgi:hypothetical protein